MPVSRIKFKRDKHRCDTAVEHTVALHHTFRHAGRPAGKFYRLQIIRAGLIGLLVDAFIAIKHIINVIIGTLMGAICADQLRCFAIKFISTIRIKNNHRWVGHINDPVQLFYTIARVQWHPNFAGGKTTKPRQ